MKDFSLSLLVFFVSISICQIAPAQVINYDVTFQDMDGKSYDRHMEVKTQLENTLEARGAQHNEKEGWVFLIGVSEPDEANNIALSITLLSRIRESVVQMGKREEAFYKPVAQQEPEKYPTEGKWVREYMSEEYMRQFFMIQGNYIEVLQKANLEATLEKMVDAFYAMPIHHWEKN